METVEMGLELEYPKIPYKDNFAIVEKTGPHNLFRVYLERGQTPTYFIGTQFTSYDKAVQSVNNYLSLKVKAKDS